MRRGEIVSIETVAIVQERLLLKVPYDTIAKSVGVDYKTVKKIADGTHVTQRQPSPYQPCPTCRCRVILPCLACRLRNDPTMKTVGAE